MMKELAVSNLPLSTIFLIEFETVLTVFVCLFFSPFILYYNNNNFIVIKHIYINMSVTNTDKQTVVCIKYTSIKKLAVNTLSYGFKTSPLMSDLITVIC
jgi:hypothetical protein